MNSIILDCRVAMYKGDAMRVLAMLDVQNDKVVISNTLPYAPPKQPFKDKSPAQVEQIKLLMRNSIVIVDNADSFRDWDMCFKEREHLDEAVRAYYSLNASHALELKDEVLRNYSPENVIQIRKMDLNGNTYELDSESITNGHVAVLLACWAAVKARNTASLETESEITQEDEDDFFTPFSI